MNNLITTIADRYNLRRRSGRYVGPCPKCGGSTKSDKFNIRDDGGFKCYSCPFKGDIITWLREMDGMSCSEAHIESGKECVASSCSVSSTCRLGKGEVQRRLPRQKTTTPRGRRAEQVATIAETSPADLWRQWATDLMDKSAEILLKRGNDLEWLANRGIDATTAERCRLGWNPRGLKMERAAIGLPPRDDGKKTIWIPDGLVIPIFDNGGGLHRLRIRRPLSSRERFLPNLKYMWIEGSGNAPMVLRPTPKNAGQIRGAVIVEAELDAFTVAGNHPQVMVISIGTVKGGLTQGLKSELHRLPVVLICLDADPEKDGKAGPGPQAIATWTTEYRNAKFWPVPSGKDPGDYAEQGGNIRAWIDAGLPPAPLAHDLPFSADCNRRGEGGKKELLSPQKTTKAPNGAVPAQKKTQQKQQQQQPLAANAARNDKNKSAKTQDLILDRIADLPEPAKSDVSTVYEIICGHPVEVWMSPDGREAGVIETSAGWKHRYPEMTRRLTGLLYGRSCAEIFCVLRDRFILVGKRSGKVA